MYTQGIRKSSLASAGSGDRQPAQGFADAAKIASASIMTCGANDCRQSARADFIPYARYTIFRAENMSSAAKGACLPFSYGDLLMKRRLTRRCSEVLH
jgi:hypothetical protein